MADVQINDAAPAHPPQHTFTGILNDLDQQTPHKNDGAPHSHDEAEGHDRHSDRASSHRWSKASSLDIDKSQPQDFDGELSTNNELPSPEVQKMIENYIVLDRHGKSRTFKSLYMGENKARRVLVIFIRHFFCGNCQEYLRTLSEAITPDSLLRLPISTFITVVGCGDPGLIDMYAKETGCQFPIYTDPTRSLFDALGMVKTLQMGTKPAYAKKSTSRGIFDSIVQGLKHVPKGLALKSGDHRQVGGEFLYEPFHVATPISTPTQEQPPKFGSLAKPETTQDNVEDERAEDKRITWCHRMKTTRDHVELPELMEVLGLDTATHKPVVKDEKDEKRWEEATRSRKGTGATMAPEMKRLSLAARASVDQAHDQAPHEPVVPEDK
ncbi:peroxiredoxin-like 2C [Trichoderma asperellum]|uniref:Peroxiredoxin-like 2C n=1 Tax=Trichoderma asperellum TaxID=101201 RepID=A0A6V8R1X1_TRIAP|nr:peroxiredoxin-like 2C [Trichoderma asperellum]